MFLSCGDALFDLFTGPRASGGHSVSAVSLSGDVGGSPLNVALGLSRLGHQSRFLTKLSSDIFGERMRRFLAANNIDTSLCIDTDLNTTLAIVDTNEDGSANYVFFIDNTADVTIEENDLPSQLPDDVRILHFGSYSTVVEPTASSLLTLARREKDKLLISYDPNLRTSIEPDMDKWREAFKGFAATAAFIKASDEDIESLLGANSEEKFVADCFNHGAQLVCVTHGPKGSYGYTPDGNQVFIKAHATQVVDTVGAGDTFQAAFIHYLVSHDHVSTDGKIQGSPDMQQAVGFASLAASVTCSRAGADLPRLDEIG